MAAGWTFGDDIGPHVLQIPALRFYAINKVRIRPTNGIYIFHKLSLAKRHMPQSNADYVTHCAASMQQKSKETTNRR